jgi:hypothetical protein
VLRQKKTYEEQLAQLQQQTFNMENAAMITENLRNTMATVSAMQVANKEMRRQYGKIDVDKIEVWGIFSVPGFWTQQMLTDLDRIYITRWRI